MKTKLLIGILFLGLILINGCLKLEVDRGVHTKDLDLSKGILYSFCNEAVNSEGYLPDNDNTAFDLFNITQEEMDEIMLKHPNGRFVDTEHCIGEYIEIKGRN